MQIFDIFLLETIVNGVLLGGVLAVLALGLNLVFGVIDVVWIAYADLVMAGMYTVYWLHTYFGLPLVLAGLGGIAFMALVGLLVHQLLIEPILNTPPVNQLLVTGGLLYFLQNLATLLFGTEFRNLGLTFSPFVIWEMYIPLPRLLAFGVSILGIVGLYLFLTRTYVGTAIRAVAQDREVMSLMGVSTHRVYLITSGVGGAMAGLAALLLVLQQDVHPHVGIIYGPITFMICVLGGLGNLVGGFAAAFLIAQIISVGSFYVSTEMSYVIAFVLFIMVMVVKPEGLFARRA